MSLHLVAVATNEAGQLLDATTGQLLQLAPESHFHLLLADPAQARPVPAPTVFEPIRRLVVPSGQTLHFKLNQTEWGPIIVVVRLLDDVWLVQDHANKLPELEKAQPCEVQQVRSSPAIFQRQPPFAPFRAESLNQAYFLASKLYEPSRASHAGNVHQHMRTGHLDLLLRDFWDMVGREPDYWAGVQPA